MKKTPPKKQAPPAPSPEFRTPEENTPEQPKPPTVSPPANSSPTAFTQAFLLKKGESSKRSEISLEDERLSDHKSIMSSSMFVRKFDGKNFGVWKAQMESYLLLKDCHEAIEKGRPYNTSDDSKKADVAKLQKEWDEKNTLARAIILLSLDDNQAAMVCNLTSSKDIWSRLTQSHEQKSQASKVAIQRQFYEANMREGETAVNFISRVQMIFNQLLEAQVKMTEENLVGRIVSGLTPAYHVFMTNWANNPETKQLMSELVPRLIAEESLISKFKHHHSREKMNIEAMVSEGSRSFKGNYRKQNDSSNYNKSTNSSGRKSNKFDKKKIKCYNCGKKGHYSSECRCPKQGAAKNSEKAKNEEEVMMVESIVAEALPSVATYHEADSAISNDMWLLDSGCSEHLSYERSYFFNFKEFEEPHKIKLGNHSIVLSYGIGSIKLIAYNGSKKNVIILKNVLYAPEMRRNLISQGVITNNHDIRGYIHGDYVIFRNKKGVRFLTVVKIGNMHKALVKEASVHNAAAFNVEDSSSTVQSVEERDNNLKLWHERLAHISRTTIVKMKKLEAVQGLVNCDVGIDPKASDRKVINCDSCCLAKQTRQPIPSSTSPRATEVGQAVHVDICGPIGQETLKGSKYFVLFKDEFSNYRVIYFIKSKEEVHDCIRRCVAQIRSDTKKKVLCLVSDNGSEFTSNRSQAYLLQEGIHHRTSAPFTPQQNGLIERDNRTVMEATRAMLFHRRLPEYLWGEAASTAVYLLNRVINRLTKDKTPYELYFGQKPRLDHVRVFGSTCYMKQQEKKRSGYQKKLEARSTKLVLVGYDRDFCYRLFDQDAKKIVITREIIVDENSIPQLDTQCTNYDNIETFIDRLPSPEQDMLENKDEKENDSDSEGEVNISQAIDDDDEPATYQQAISSTDSKFWVRAMREEYDSLIKNETWRLEQPPTKVKPIKCKWVYKIKKNADGSIARYKARLVAKGYSQKAGIDYGATFSPVVRHESVRLILSIAAKEDLELIHFDVKTAFLYGSLDEEIWIQQPEGFESNDKRLACRLLKSLYGLKQASRAWNTCFINFLKKFDLQPTRSDSCVLIRMKHDGMLIIAIYVDDGLACGSNKLLLNEVVSYLREKFDITIMEAKCFVGINIIRDRESKKITINQSTYINNMVRRFELEDSLPAPTPMAVNINFIKTGVANGEDSKSVDVPYREAIGSINYAMCCTRPDIACAFNILSRFCAEPKLPHWHAVKRVIKYLKGTAELGIVYDGSNHELIAYSDSDYGGCLDSRHSVSGFLVKHCGGPIIWRSQKQSTVAESTTEAEFISCSSVSREVIWVRHLMEEIYGKSPSQPTVIKVDNQSAIKFIQNKQVRTRIKHIDIRLMAVREREEEKKIKVDYVNTDDQLADLLTKPLAAPKFSHFVKNLAMAIAVLLLLTMLSSTDAMSMKLGKLTPKSRVSSGKLTLKVISPCAQVEAAEEMLRGSIILNEEGKLNSSLIEVTRAICKSAFKNRVLTELNNLNGCLPLRPKRDLTAVASLASTIAGMIAGVTNLIRGSTESTTATAKRDTLALLGLQVDERSRMALVDRSTMTRETEQELGIVSETANYHLANIVEQSRQIPMLVWTTYHVVHELYAGAANIQAIGEQCRKRRLATHELGEMLEYTTLGEIDPSNTVLESLVVNQNESTVDFIYNTTEPFEIDLDYMAPFMLAVIILVYILSILRHNVRIVKNLSHGHHVNTRDTYESEPSPSSGLTFNSRRLSLNV